MAMQSSRHLLVSGELPRSVVVVVLLPLLMLVSGCRTYMGTVVIVNKSSVALPETVVSVCSQRFSTKDLAVGASTKHEYRITCEGDFSVEVRRQSGQTARQQLGYVTTGMNIHYEFFVTDTGIEFGSQRID
jgi:hypothetical protein